MSLAFASKVSLINASVIVQNGRANVHRKWGPFDSLFLYSIH